jgi:predicted PurR-regulated permease PerM
MWLPIALFEIFSGSIPNAVYISLYSIIVISIIADTFIKPMIIKYINKRVVKTPTAVNELLIFFSIIAGLATIGFWGMIIGPALVTFFISIMQLIKKYNKRVTSN